MAKLKYHITAHGADSNLSDEQIRSEVPAVFAERAYDKMSDRYAFIPTSGVLQTMRMDGWRVRAAAQHGVRNLDKEPYTRHSLRLWHPDYPTAPDPRGGAGLKPEVILVNGHDGSARYTLYAGLFSFVCLNGLMAGSMYGGVSVVHTGGEQTRMKVLTESRDLAIKAFPGILASVELMAAKVINDAQRSSLAAHALALRYRSTTPVITADQLLERHRDADLNTNLWTALNVVQENVLSRSHEGRSAWGRRTNIRRVSQVKEQVLINRGLWDKAMELLVDGAL
jgi:Domain of unknown function (DUF932)